MSTGTVVPVSEYLATSYRPIANIWTASYWGETLYARDAVQEVKDDALTTAEPAICVALTELE